MTAKISILLISKLNIHSFWKKIFKLAEGVHYNYFPFPHSDIMTEKPIQIH